MKTKHYLQKKIVYSLFGEKNYHKIKSKKILFDHLIGKDYDGIYKYLSKILSSDSVVFDIGANMGQYLCRLSRIVKNGKIISVEPIPENVVALKFMKKVLRISNAAIVEKAISSTQGSEEINIPRLNNIPITTQASLLKKADELGDIESITVQTTTLAGLVKEFNLDRLDFVKVDTEGFDSVVLNSGKSIIQEFKPLLKIESSGFDEEIKWLFDTGYIAFKIHNNKIGVLHNKDDAKGFMGDTFFATEKHLDRIKRSISY